MLTLLAILITVVGLIGISLLVYQGEQKQSDLSKGVTILTVFGLICLIVFAWYEALTIGQQVNQILNK